jgi:group I intron endonuclease
MAEPDYYWRGFRANPENPPLQRPGAYLLRHIASGKCYIGISANVAKRLIEHARPSAVKSQMLIHKALHKHGLAAFDVVPLFYSLKGTEGLSSIEADMIVDYDTIMPKGYNLLENHGSVGPYGPAFSEKMREVINRPEVREKMGKSWYSPDRNAEHSARMTERWNDPALSEAWRTSRATPEARGRISTAIKSHYEDPDARKRQAEKSREAWADPAVRKKHVDGARAQFADPIKKARNQAGLNVVRASPEFRARMSESQREYLANNPDAIVSFVANMKTPEAIAKRKKKLADPEVRAKRAAAMKVSASRPEAMARSKATMTAYYAIPGNRERIVKAMHAANARPEVRAIIKAKNSESGRLRFADPEYRAKHAARMREAMARPEVRARQLAGLALRKANRKST